MDHRLCQHAKCALDLYSQLGMNKVTCRNLLSQPTLLHMVLPCTVCSSTHYHQIDTIQELKCPPPTSGTMTFLQMRDNPMLTPGNGLKYSESDPKRHRPPDSSVQTSSFSHRKICQCYTQNACNHSGMACVSKLKFHLLPLHNIQHLLLKLHRSLGQ